MRFIRRFFVVLGIASALAVMALAVYIVLLATQVAEQTLRPPVKPMSQLPTRVGIRDYQDVTFTTWDGVRLSGWYAAPQAQTGKVIIFAHGYAHNREMLLPEAGVLAAQGLGVLLFDFRGHGKSGPALVTLGDHERLDLRAAVDFVSGQPGMKATLTLPPAKTRRVWCAFSANDRH